MKSLLYTYIVAPPQITTHPTDTSAATPFSGVFTCSASGYGYLNIVWYRTPGVLPDKSSISEVHSPKITTSTLVIPNVTNDDVGDYHCIVRTRNFGVWSEIARLYYGSTYDIIYLSYILLHMEYTWA